MVTTIGFAVGGVMMGRAADRFGITVPLFAGAIALGAGFVLAAFSASYWQFLVVQAVLIGMLGSSSTFGPLVADVSQGSQGAASPLPSLRAALLLAVDAHLRRHRCLAGVSLYSDQHFASTMMPGAALPGARLSMMWRARERQFGGGSRETGSSADAHLVALPAAWPYPCESISSLIVRISVTAGARRECFPHAGFVVSWLARRRPDRRSAP
jgi:MFS family permease